MAVNDKDPTEAIQLVEQTIGTFHQIVVGQEGQMVPVPGYPDQPTLAERVKQNLKPSTDAAAGYAAQAREEATKAAREADRASQIAGLDAVSEAVGLAAIPFPDVWIPLSDSLRMLAGYGREVKVGDDVVARYATLTRNTTGTLMNKSGALVNAGVNEPRFERSGLLNENQSANIITDSSGKTGITKGVAATWYFDGVGLWGQADALKVVGLHGISYSASGGALYKTNIPVIHGSSYAFSFDFYNSTNEQCEIQARISSPDTRKVQVAPPLAWTRVEVIIVPEGSKLSFAIGTTSDSELCDGVIDNIQLEAMPNATSRIVTTEAVTTRAADKLTIPRLNNDCAEWYSGSDQINPIITEDTIELVPPAGKLHLRNVRGFFTPLTPAQKAALK